VRVTGTKAETKTYYRHSGYIGNLKQIPMKDMLEKKPEETILLAVKGMLPATKRGREMLGRLKIYTGDSNPHKSQTPESQEGR
jgi:large subunit ribosomal protein L13